MKYYHIKTLQCDTHKKNPSINERETYELHGNDDDWSKWNTQIQKIAERRRRIIVVLQHKICVMRGSLGALEKEGHHYKSAFALSEREKKSEKQQRERKSDRKEDDKNERRKQSEMK